jgi:hypothetical protein
MFTWFCHVILSVDDDFFDDLSFTAILLWQKD